MLRPVLEATAQKQRVQTLLLRVSLMAVGELGVRDIVKNSRFQSRLPGFKSQLHQFLVA